MIAEGIPSPSSVGIFTGQMRTVGKDVSILDNYEFKLDVWYMTRDYKDLYKIVREGNTFYTVISFGDWKQQFTFPGIIPVMDFMKENCFSHTKYERVVEDGK